DTSFVLCPDTLGRGLSAWAGDPSKDYAFAVFVEHALAILEHFSIGKLRWVGTSMGGLLGIVLAAGPLRDRITHFVINDVGPVLPKDAVDRIVTYAGNPPTFDTVTEMETWLRSVYAPFGGNSDDFWRRLVETSIRRTDSGRITVHYDPKIVMQLVEQPGDFELWQKWDDITASTLLLRGATSDVLLPALAEEMKSRGPRPRCETFPDVGHAPTLTTDREIGLVRNFLAV
ncbi:MAG: alpha/beta fold hydrolase, partial [Pseudomonadota bacterium]|nr:alpha/beta fold hydrolase [Pseudomonadota bacterium]